MCSHSVDREYFVILERYFITDFYSIKIYYYCILTKINIMQTPLLNYILKIILLKIESGALNNILNKLAVMVVLFSVKY